MRKYLTVAGVLLAMSASQVMAETLLERGTYLMQGISGCGNCHTARADRWQNMSWPAVLR